MLTVLQNLLWGLFCVLLIFIGIIVLLTFTPKRYNTFQNTLEELQKNYRCTCWRFAKKSLIIYGEDLQGWHKIRQIPVNALDCLFYDSYGKWVNYQNNYYLVLNNYESFTVAPTLVDWNTVVE